MREILELVGSFIRWVVIFKCDYKKKNEAHNQNFDDEIFRDFIVGLVFIVFIVGIIILYQLFYR